MGNLYRYVEPVVLYLLKEKGSAHGYELARALDKHTLTDSVIDPGALYRTLRSLEANGCVVSNWQVGGSGPPKRVYQLTPQGEEHLREWITVLSHLAESMSGFVSDAQRMVEGSASGASDKSS